MAIVSPSATFVLPLFSLPSRGSRLQARERDRLWGHRGDGEAVGVGHQVDALNAGVREHALAVSCTADFCGSRPVITVKTGVLEMLFGRRERHARGDGLPNDRLEALVVFGAHPGTGGEEEAHRENHGAGTNDSAQR